MERPVPRPEPDDRDRYRLIARWYDGIFGRMNEGLRQIGLKMFPPREGLSVLDVGCGTGIQLAAYQKAGCHVYGIDSSASMLESARRRLGDRASLELADASAMPYPSGNFDLIVSSTALHEMSRETRRRVMREMARTLRPDGRILLIDFEPGLVRPLRGWVTKAVISISEVAAGGDHLRNYRDFMARGGLGPLVESAGLTVEIRRIVGGGTIGLYLAATAPGGHT